MTKKQREKQRRMLLSIAAFVVVAAFYMLYEHVPWFGELFDRLSQSAGLTVETTQAQGDLLVHFLDVGQGDSILIQTPEENVLIDASVADQGDKIVSYLKAQHVQRLDRVFVSHLHADHIGGMAKVLNAVEVEEIIFPPTPEAILPTSKTYERLLDAIEENGLEITESAPGQEYALGGGVIMQILGPVGDDYDNLNNTSLVCRVVYDDSAFLFCGDAERMSEREILAAYTPKELSANVLKLGHHGSNTSTGQDWLDAVSPQIAVAQLGADNDYGHPHKEVVKRLEDRNITFYRTDLSGNIVIGSDGKKLSVALQKEAA